MTPATTSAEKNGSVDTRELARAGWAVNRWGDLGGGRFAPDEVGLPTYHRMWRTDPTVKAGLSLLAHTVSARIGDYANPARPDVEAFVRYALAKIEGTLPGVVRGLLTAFWAGFSVAELVWRMVDEGAFRGKVTLRKVKALHPLSIYPDGMLTDKLGNVTFVRQRLSPDDEVTLPVGKTLRYVFHAEEDPVWGMSLLRTVYKSWFCKDAVLKFWNVYLERYSMPIIVAEVPPGTSKCPVHGVEETNTQVFDELLQTLAVRTSIAYEKPAEGGPPHLEFLEAKRGGAVGEYRDAVRYHDAQILLGLFQPALLMLEPEHASRAQAETQLQVFEQTATAITREVREALIDGLVRPLVDLNFRGVGEYGAFGSGGEGKEEVGK